MGYLLPDKWCFIELQETGSRFAAARREGPLATADIYLRDYAMLAGYFGFTNFVYSIQKVFHCQGKIWLAVTAFANTENRRDEWALTLCNHWAGARGAPGMGSVADQAAEFPRRGGGGFEMTFGAGK